MWPLALDGIPACVDLLEDGHLVVVRCRGCQEVAVFSAGGVLLRALLAVARAHEGCGAVRDREGMVATVRAALGR